MRQAEIKDLRQRRRALVGQMRSILDKMEAQNRNILSSEERQEYDRIESEVKSLGGQIEQLERSDASESETRDRPSSEARDRPNATPGYRAAFDRFLRSQGRDFEARAALATTTDSAGGYTVPVQMYDTIVDSLIATSPIRELATVLETDDGQPLNIPVRNAKEAFSWRTEGGAYSESEPSFSRVTLGAYSSGGIALASDELIADSAFDIESYLATQFGLAAGVAMDDAFVNGAANSTTTPKGIANQATVGVTCASATAIASDEVFDLLYSVLRPYRANVVFLFAESSMSAIRQLKDSKGDYLWGTGLDAGEPDTLLGRPVYADPYIPAIAASAIVGLFGDVKRGYYVRQVNTIGLKVLNELYAADGQIGFRFGLRVDGALVDSNAVATMAMAA